MKFYYDPEITERQAVWTYSPIPAYPIEIIEEFGMSEKVKKAKALRKRVFEKPQAPSIKELTATPAKYRYYL